MRISDWSSDVCSSDLDMGIAHEKIEKNIGLLAVLVAVAVSLGGLAEIVPVMYEAEANQPLPGVKRCPALELAGREVYESAGGGAEESHEGKGGVRWCRHRWSTERERKK